MALALLLIAAALGDPGNPSNSVFECHRVKAANLPVASK